MALVGRRDGRNFGYGRQLSYAGPQALRDIFGGGHYGTVKAHSDRWQAFVRWCRSKDGPGFNDARQIDRQTLLDYAGHLRQQVEQGELAIATAQNRLSSVNRTLAALRGDQYVKVPSPSNALEMQRTTIRMTVPQGQDREHVIRIVDALREDHPRAAAIALLARVTGMRLREAILADLPRLLREAEITGRSTFRTAPKVAVQAHRHPGGSQWMIILAKHSGMPSSSLPTVVATCWHRTKATSISKKESPAQPETSSIHTTSKASMNCGPPMHANAMSRSPIT